MVTQIFKLYNIECTSSCWITLLLVLLHYNMTIYIFNY